MGSRRPIATLLLALLAAGAARADDLPLSPRKAGGEDQRDGGVRPLPELTGAPVELLPASLPGQTVNASVFIGYRGSEGETTGAIATVSPWWRSFARVGIEATPRSRTGDVRMLWEIGLEDWRDRSFFLRVHDWGPVWPGEKLGVRRAEAVAGYKLPRLRGGAFGLGVTAVAALPFSGGPYLGARATVTVAETWFVAGGLARTIPGALPGSGDAPAWRASFALGRWDWRPGSLFVSYGDEVNLDRLGAWTVHDRQGRGVLALGVNGAL